MNKGIAGTLLAAVSLAAGWGVYHFTQTPGNEVKTNQASTQTKQQKTLSVLNQKRADFTLPDLQGNKHSIKDWDNKVILLNFWATWCPPCRREIPAFIELQEQFGPQGFQVIGVAIDERDAVEDYTDGLGVNYPVLIGNNDALNISSAYGNRFGQLPYSLVIDRQGIIRFIGKRELSFADIEKQIKPLL